MRNAKIYTRDFPLMGWEWSLIIMALSLGILFLSFMVLGFPFDGFFFVSIFIILMLVMLIVFRFLFRIFALKFVQISTSATATVIEKYLNEFDDEVDYFIHLQHTDASKNLIWKMKVKEKFYSEIGTGDGLKLYYAESNPKWMLLEIEANALPHPLNIFKSGSI